MSEGREIFPALHPLFQAAGADDKPAGRNDVMRAIIYDLLRDERLFCVGLFGILAIVKLPQLFIDPRFCVEEGPNYFATFQTMSMWDTLPFCYRGSCQGATNLVVYAATLAPIRYAPTATTYFPPTP
jgi:hypothetical protein